MDDDLQAELDYHIAEAELTLVKDEPLSAELRTYIKPSTLSRLVEYCREHKTSDKVVIEVVLAAYLYEQGY